MWLNVEFCVLGAVYNVAVVVNFFLAPSWHQREFGPPSRDPYPFTDSQKA